MEAIFKYELGQELKDVVSNFKGIVIGRTEYLTGCKHYGLQPRGLTKDGKSFDIEWYDESRLVPTKTKIQLEKPMTSGPSPTPPRVQ